MTPFDAQCGDVFPAVLEHAVFGAGRRAGAGLLDGLDLEISGRAPLVLLGPNGAGKSLALRMLQGLITPESGSVRFAGRPAQSGDFRRVALVFQRPVLLRRSVSANLEHALRAYGVPRAERAGRIEALLGMGALTGLEARPARVLSGGEQQRLALVRALAAEPRLLLLDEPAASLDPQSTLAVERLMRQAAEAGVKLVLVTHDVGQARRLAGEVAFLHRGKRLEAGSADAFFDRPQTEEARAYLSGKLVL